MMLIDVPMRVNVLLGVRNAADHHAQYALWDIGSIMKFVKDYAPRLFFTLRIEVAKYVHKIV